MQLTDAYLLLRRASLLASGDETLPPVVRYHLALVEVQMYLLLGECSCCPPPEADVEPDYPLGAAECIAQANQVALRYAAEEPGILSPDLLWGLTEVLGEFRDHEAERHDEHTQHLLAEHD